MISVAPRTRCKKTSPPKSSAGRLSKYKEDGTDRPRHPERRVKLTLSGLRFSSEKIHVRRSSQLILLHIPLWGIKDRLNRHGFMGPHHIFVKIQVLKIWIFSAVSTEGASAFCATSDYLMYRLCYSVFSKPKPYLLVARSRKYRLTVHFFAAIWSPIP